MAFKITTTGTQSPVVFDDLGARSFSHPIVDYDLETEYDIDELRKSSDIQSAITSGWITVKDELNNVITTPGDVEVLNGRNVNVGGIGVLKQKTGKNLEFRGINSGSSKITIVLDANNEIDVDAAESAFTLNNIGGTLGISKGGTGQVTASAAFNALSPNTTKGDIIVYDTANNRLPVGTDGQLLLADSTQALGVKWGDASEIAGQALRFLSSNTGNSQTVVNTISEINFTDNMTNYTLPVDTLNQYSLLRFLVYGRFSTKGGAVGTLTVRLKINNLVINTNVCSLGSGDSNLGFQFTGQFHTRTLGVSGTVYSHLLCIFNGDSSTPTSYVSSSNGTNIIDTTAPNTIQMSAQWSNANASNSITIEQVSFEILN